MFASSPRRLLLASLASACVLAAGCKVGPQYVRPAAPLAPEFKELGPDAFKATDGWKAAQPSDQQLKGTWWEVFSDPQLNSLEAEIDSANQTLKQADANFQAARAQIRFYRANQAPTIGTAPSIASERFSANRPYFNTNLANNGTGDFQLPLDLNYEIDLWGRIRRSITAAREEAQASSADLENARLSLHAELAIDYFGLRAADAQKKLLDDTVVAYQRAVQLTSDRYTGGASPLSDLTQAQTQLQAALVQSTDVTIQRAQFEHAIAVLVGKPPAALTIPPIPVTIQPPALPNIPGALPSQLLERRPDIASEERRMAAANEQIGIAQAAFYPTLSLAAAAGFEGTSALNWFSWPSRVWAVGPTLSQTLFDHGRRRANSDIATSQYDSNVASYRQTTLTAFQQVEDNLTSLRQLETEAIQQHGATSSAEQSLDLFNTRYEGGVDTYLQVVTSQTAALQNERNDIEIMRRRLDASVLLIKALGGGWNTTQLPTNP
ncbi:efflux transporter outer membrane subunit [Granulicella sp. dw_53]|uniref:efflux transporter outer membrane subunit n=1 Tax=Granulicella sp. dw_53 TaxID=2719792 RepID=UPI001BD5CB63|nr:efflux transporter outer membrane subunit [Granulicella sp. dw_53]